jgi:uncharacterized protein (DUF427 family)
LLFAAELSVLAALLLYAGGERDGATALPIEEGLAMKAIWNGQVVAESDDIVKVEGNAYFPAASLNTGYVKESATKSNCPWKGTASYYTLAVNGAENKDAAWYYPEPKQAAAEIKGRVAFWKGVTVS